MMLTSEEGSGDEAIEIGEVCGNGRKKAPLADDCAGLAQSET